MKSFVLTLVAISVLVTSLSTMSYETFSQGSNKGPSKSPIIIPQVTLPKIGIYPYKGSMYPLFQTNTPYDAGCINSTDSTYKALLTLGTSYQKNAAHFFDPSLGLAQSTQQDPQQPSKWYAYWQAPNPSCSTS